MRVLSTTQVAKLLGVSDQSVANWIDSGKLVAGKTPGGHRRVQREDLVNFLKQQNLRIPSEIMRSSLGVLLVDDQKEIIQFLHKALRDKHPDWTIFLAHDGFAAGEIVAVEHPDVVVLDLFMPGMDGFEVCRRIKSNVATRDISVITITAHPSPENEKAALDSGASAFLPKPIEVNNLSLAIKRLLSIVS